MITFKQFLLLESQLQDWNKYTSENPMLKAAIEVLEELSRYGKAYIVGGAVRDIVLGIEPHDVDIATNVPMAKIEELFKSHDIGKNKDFGIVVIQHAGHTFEVAQFRKDGTYTDGRRPDSVEIVMDFKDDAARRDFTINAMAVDKDGNIIDYFDGQRDIKNKLIRTVGDPEKRFSEDYLRMMRVARFSSRFGYDIEDSTLSAVKKSSHKISKIAIERVTQEIVKAAQQSGEKFAKFIETLNDSGILQHILPEVVALDNFEHSDEDHPEGIYVQKILS